MTFRIALDRSARTFDADGRLHVGLTPISKAQVSPYYGREIPGAEALGLDPDKVYHLLRHPDELAKGAATFNNMPLMAGHIVVSAEAPAKERVVGSLGTDAVFNAPYLYNSLVVWDALAIRKIETGECREISCGYRYQPDMTPGDYEGLHYDGIMRNIIANHVALVEQGRAGPDVVVADAQIGDRPVKTSKIALLARGAIAAYVGPLLAADKKLDLKMALDGVTADNFDAMKPAIIGRVTNDAAGKLIDGASLSRLAVVLDAMEKECEDEDPDDEDEKDKPEAKDRKRGKDEDPDDKPEAKDRKRGKDADPDEEADKEAEARDRKRGKDADPEPKPDTAGDRRAMDAAIDAAVTRRVEAARAVDEAKLAVRPHVGEVHACDSADQVYRFALDSAQVRYDRAVHPSAFKALWELHVSRLAQDAEPVPHIANDADDRFLAAFPDAKRFARV